MKTLSLLKTCLVLLSLSNFALCYTTKWWKANMVTTGYACKTVVSETALYCELDDDYDYACQCSDVVGMGALVYCGYTETEGNAASRKRFEDYFIAQCPGYNVTHQQIADSYANVTKYIKDAEDVPGFNATIPTRVPIKYSRELYDVTYRSIYQYYYNCDVGIIYGAALVAFWAAVFSIFFIFRVFELMNLTDSFITNNKVYKYFQAHFLIKAVFGKRHKRDIYIGLVPVRIDTFMIFAFVLINMVGCFANIYYVSDSVWFYGRKDQIGRMIGDRTAYISVFTMNLTFLFAGRNNIFLWLTGWNFQSFLTYHKWVARVTVWNVLVHALAYLIILVDENYLASFSIDAWYRWGCVAGVACSIMVIQGFYPLRKVAYELFLYVHIVMAIIFLIGTWYHLLVFEMQYYMYGTFAVWGFDRLMRLIFIAMFGGFKKNQVKIVDDQFLVLTINNYNKKLFKPQPGNFVFVHFGLWKCFWESHPFTIVSSNNGELKVMASIKKGCTQKVKNYILAQNLTSFNLPIAMEGPYGVTKDRIVSRDQNIFMYSTNTGAAGPYYYLKSFIDKDITHGKNIKFYWGVKNWSSLEVFSEELKTLSGCADIDVTVYVSQYSEGALVASTSSEIDISQQEEKNINKDTSTVSNASTDSFSLNHIQNVYPNVHFKAGRLPIAETVTKDVEESLDNTNITVMTCGHPDFCDEVRDSVCNNITKNKTKNIHLIDELQVW